MQFHAFFAVFIDVLLACFFAIHLWKRHGFEVIGTLPEAFRHPQLGFVDALVMYKKLKE